MAEDEDFPTFELIPADPEEVTPDEELAGLVDPEDIQDIEQEDDTLPIGRTIAFDFDLGMAGSRPQWVSGVQAVVMVAQVAIRTKRGEHSIFDDEFGMDAPELLIGHSDDAERKAIYIADLTETLMSCHDRITNVKDFLFLRDADDEIAYIDLTIEIDGDDEARLEGISL